MKIELNRGCICTGFYFDNKSEDKYSEQEIKAIRSKLCDYINSSDIDLFDIVEFIMTEKGDYECSDHPCDCCGDFIETYKLEI